MGDLGERRRARGGGGAARRAERTAIRIEAARFIERNIPNLDILNAEAIEIIESNAETVLEEIGVNFVENPEALELWRKAGASVDGERVRLPRGLARSLCKTAPSSYVQHARNPERSVTPPVVKCYRLAVQFDECNFQQLPFGKLFGFGNVIVLGLSVPENRCSRIAFPASVLYGETALHQCLDLLQINIPKGPEAYLAAFLQHSFVAAAALPMAAFQ